jgi:hypothetical protein
MNTTPRERNDTSNRHGSGSPHVQVASGTVSISAWLTSQETYLDKTLLSGNYPYGEEESSSDVPLYSLKHRSTHPKSQSVEPFDGTSLMEKAMLL